MNIEYMIQIFKLLMKKYTAEDTETPLVLTDADKLLLANNSLSEEALLVFRLKD